MYMYTIMPGKCMVKYCDWLSIDIDGEENWSMDKQEDSGVHWRGGANSH